MKKIIFLFIFSLSIIKSLYPSVTLANSKEMDIERAEVLSGRADSWKKFAVHYLPTTAVATVAGICVAMGIVIFKGIK